MKASSTAAPGVTDVLKQAALADGDGFVAAAAVVIVGTDGSIVHEVSDMTAEQRQLMASGLARLLEELLTEGRRRTG